MGRTRVPRVSSAVAPEILSHVILGIPGGEKLVRRGLVRDAKNHKPEASVSRKTASPARSRTLRNPGWAKPIRNEFADADGCDGACWRSFHGASGRSWPS